MGLRRYVVEDRVCLLYEGLLIAVARCVMGTWVFVFRDAVRERLLSYARHCRWFRLYQLFQCCGLVRQRNRTMVDGSAQSGARWACSDICWNSGHLRWGLRRYIVEDFVCLLCDGRLIAVGKMCYGNMGCM